MAQVVRMIVRCLPSLEKQLLKRACRLRAVNSIAWAPHELGAILACASSDGNVSVLTFNG